MRLNERGLRMRIALAAGTIAAATAAAPASDQLLPRFYVGEWNAGQRFPYKLKLVSE